jgi:hypothetical protein
VTTIVESDACECSEPSWSSTRVPLHSAEAASLLAMTCLGRDTAWLSIRVVALAPGSSLAMVSARDIGGRTGREGYSCLAVVAGSVDLSTWPFRAATTSGSGSAVVGPAPTWHYVHAADPAGWGPAMR